MSVQGVQSFVEETEKELQRLIEENSNLEAKLAKKTLEADQAAEVTATLQFHSLMSAVDRL